MKTLSFELLSSFNPVVVALAYTAQALPASELFGKCPSTGVSICVGIETNDEHNLFVPGSCHLDVLNTNKEGIRKIFQKFQTWSD